MVTISFPGQYQIQVKQNWRDRKEPLIYTLVIFLFTIIGTTYSFITKHYSPAFLSILLFLLVFMIFTNLLPVASLTFDVEKNYWEIRHQILFVPTRLHSGQILNISSLAVVKTLDTRGKRKNTSDERSSLLKSSKKIKITLELWGFQKRDGNRETFIALNHDYHSLSQAEKGIITYIDLGTEILHFFQKFQIPIDLETANREIHETEI